MVNKKIVIIVTIIATIVVAGIVYISLNREDQEQYTFSEETVGIDIQNNKENTEKEQTKENTVEENEYKEIEENTIEKEIINEKEEENVESDSTSDNKEDEEEKLTDEDKAISLVKKEWGENDSTVYYNVEEQVSDNLYIISVRDQATTQELSTYKVDISNDVVEKD